MQLFLKFIPNLFTLGNLFCGSMSVMLAFKSNYFYAACFVFAGALFDFFDGFLARILKSDGELGKQLDSLADVITFGFAPSVTMFTLIQQTLKTSEFNSISLTFFGYNILSYTAFLILLCSAFRLAKFNLDTRQTTGFIGLPTPANALFITSLPFWFIHKNILFNIIHPFLLILVCFIFSFLLISQISLFALKFKNYKFSENYFKYILLMASAALLILFDFRAFTFVIPLYVFLSIIQNIFLKTK